MNVKNYEIKLKVLSPLHIGSGETLNPLRYVVKNNILYYLNESQYIRELLKTPNSHLEQVVKTDNIYNIVNYFVDCFDETNTDTWQHSYKVDNQFQQAFDKNLKSPDNQNNLFEFYRTDLFKTPVIPGSSIKGCFRTVMLSAMQRKLKIEDVMEVVGDGKEKPNSQKTEAKILGNLSVKITEKAGKKLTQTSIDVAKDPFKYIKISDIAVGTSAMTVKKIFNKKNNTDEGIPYYAEMLNKGDLVYSGTMSIDSRFDIEIARILG
ncbi:MAG TPA: type III-A CRISPR-associated RAMP protein Csm5, partial [Candidatus Cloacimonadota bacterium]|nr:type III-A CRISPR-associated RAMP protein Csm5 [Candidatus Cloacimonadota bacterium]